jgi:hypothetical protein
MGAGSIVHTGKETYFRDIYLFLDQARDMLPTKGDNYIRENLWQCLRGSAMEWWTSVLSDAEKHFIKTSGDGLAN